jgi:hypothetical protein
MYVEEPEDEGDDEVDDDDISTDEEGSDHSAVSDDDDIIVLEPPEVEAARTGPSTPATPFDEYTPLVVDQPPSSHASQSDGPPSDLRRCIDDYGKAVMQCAVLTSDDSDTIAADILTAIEKTLACHRREINKVVEGSRMMYDQVAGDSQNARAKIGELEKRVEVEQALTASLQAACDKVMAEKLALDNEVAKEKEEADNNRKIRMDLFMGTTSKKSKGG